MTRRANGCGSDRKCGGNGDDIQEGPSTVHGYMDAIDYAGNTQRTLHLWLRYVSVGLPMDLLDPGNRKCSHVPVGLLVQRRDYR
jgi:hypothetical protein